MSAAETASIAAAKERRMKAPLVFGFPGRGKTAPPIKSKRPPKRAAFASQPKNLGRLFGLAGLDRLGPVPQNGVGFIQDQNHQRGLFLFRVGELLHAAEIVIARDLFAVIDDGNLAVLFSHYHGNDTLHGSTSFWR